VTCVPWINLVCFVFVLMELYVIAAIFQLHRDNQSKVVLVDKAGEYCRPWASNCTLSQVERTLFL
jgi:hypothetical protein